MALERHNALGNNPNRVNRDQIVTLHDLELFGESMLTAIASLLKEKTDSPKQWLKSAEVRKLLNISPGTLQTLRINRVIDHTFVGGTIYYSYADIQQVMEKNKVTSERPPYHSK